MTAIRIIATILLAGAAPAAAVDARPGLSEAEAVRLALAASPELMAMRQGGTALSARVSRLVYLANPEVRTGISDAMDDLDPDERRRTNVGLRWSPPRIGEPGSRRELAKARAEEARDQVRAAENRVAAEVRLLHRTIRLMDEQVRLAEEEVRLREQILATVVAQVEAGLKTALDRSRAELDLAEIRPAPARRRAERDLQTMRLARMVELPEPLRLEHEGDPLAFSPLAANRVKLLQEALANRAEPASAAARSRQAEVNLGALRRERYPWISYVQFSRQTRAGEPGRWVFQVGVDLPVFRSADERATAAELRHVQLQGQAVRAGIATDVDEVLLRLEAVGRELAAHAGEFERLTGRHAEIAGEQLASGASDRVEALLAGVRRNGARQMFVSKLMEYRALEIGLEQALGRAASTA